VGGAWLSIKRRGRVIEEQSIFRSRIQFGSQCAVKVQSDITVSLGKVRVGLRNLIAVGKGLEQLVITSFIVHVR
jgi:hypothetical protein